MGIRSGRASKVAKLLERKFLMNCTAVGPSCASPSTCICASPQAVCPSQWSDALLPLDETSGTDVFPKYRTLQCMKHQQQQHDDGDDAYTVPHSFTRIGRSMFYYSMFYYSTYLLYTDGSNRDAFTS